MLTTALPMACDSAGLEGLDSAQKAPPPDANGTSSLGLKLPFTVVIPKRHFHPLHGTTDPPPKRSYAGSGLLFRYASLILAGFLTAEVGWDHLRRLAVRGRGAAGKASSNRIPKDPELAHTSPPCAVMMALTIASPKPLPDSALLRCGASR